MLAALLCVASVRAVAQEPETGKQLYAACAACHGDQAQGNRALNAPSLVNQQGWYLIRQLQHFRAGVRGTHAEDPYGAQMLPMARSLANEQAVIDVVAYIGSLPDVAAATTLKGDLLNGKQFYGTLCSACHAGNAGGNDKLNAPALRGIDDWYLARQFSLFKAGIRGSHPDDRFGRQMVAMAKTLPSEQVIRDVSAYIASLPLAPGDK